MARTTKLARDIENFWGERCPDNEPGCPICDAWALYDNRKFRRVRAEMRAMETWIAEGEVATDHKPPHMVIFRVKEGDVYEMPVQAKSYAGAQARALAFIGVKRSDVIVCR